MNKRQLKEGGKNVSVCESGFSFGVLFFGALKPLLKKDYKHALIILITQILVCLLMFLFIKNILVLIVTCSYMILMINLLFAANYNRLYLEEMIEKGYVPRDGFEGVKLYEKGIYYSYK